MNNKAHFTVEEIINITSGTLVNGLEYLETRNSKLGTRNSVLEITGISTDTRTIEEGNMFVALKGDNFDGNEFIDMALKKGAAGVVGSSLKMLENNIALDKGYKHKSFIFVEDTLNAYQEIARFHRDRFLPRVVAVTGSNGKSTTKEMAASIAGTMYHTLKNEGNLNNHIGLPMTLLRLSGEEEVLIIEMGMSGAGEIRRLCEIASPNIGVITNVAPAHMDRLSSLADIRRAKGELIEALEEDGTAIFNADDPNVISLRDGFRGKVITFGIEREADVMGRSIRCDIEDYLLEITLRSEKATIRLPCLGYHNIYNALAAAAVGMALNIGLSRIVTGIESYRPLPMRMEVIKLGNIVVVNDAYNANPGSMKMAIKTLSAFKSRGRKIFIVGDMLELGKKSEELHQELGRLVVSEGIDILYTLGEKSSLAAREAINSGMSRDQVYQCADHDQVILMINKKLRDGDCVMVKGSRGMRMEIIIDGLKRIRMSA